MVELVAEHGYEGVTVRGLARLAGVSTGSFYKRFVNVEACFVSTYEFAMRRALRRAYVAQREAKEKEEGVRAALRSLLTDVAARPKEARLVLVEAYAVGPPMQPLMARGTTGLERILSDAFAPVPADAPVPALLARGIAAGAIRVARARLLAGGAAELPDLAAELGDWVIDLSTQGVVGMTLSPAGRQEGTERQPGEELSKAFPTAAGNERARILAAVAKISSADGYEKLTLSRIRVQAGISRRTFHSYFSEVRDSYLEMIETLARRSGQRAWCLARADPVGEPRIPRAVASLCADAARNPILAGLCLSAILSPGSEGLYRRERLVSLAAAQLIADRPEPRKPDALRAEASIAAVWGIAEAEVAAGRAHRATSLAPLLTRVLAAAEEARSLPVGA
jgi:AcrR family transcriptional regulator